MNNTEKNQLGIRISAFHTGFLQMIIVLAGLIFIRKEIYTSLKFSLANFSIQEYLLILLSFTDGFFRAKLDNLQIQEKVLLLKEKNLSWQFDFTKRFNKYNFFIGLFLIVSCSSLCCKVNFAALKSPIYSTFGLILLVLTIVFRIVCVRTFPTIMSFKSLTNSSEKSEKFQTKDFKFPWKFIRYPNEFAQLLFYLGSIATLESWLTLLSLPGIFILYKWQIAEREFLRQNVFADSYQNYQKNSFIIVPFIY